MTASCARAAALGLTALPTAWLLVVPLSPTNNEPPTLLIRNGPWALLLLAVPMVLTITPLLVRPTRARRVVTAISAILLTLDALLVLMIVGWIYLPSAVALLSATVLRDPEPMSNRGHR